MFDNSDVPSFNIKLRVQVCRLVIPHVCVGRIRSLHPGDNIRAAVMELTVICFGINITCIHCGCKRSVILLGGSSLRVFNWLANGNSRTWLEEVGFRCFLLNLMRLNVGSMADLRREGQVGESGWLALGNVASDVLDAELDQVLLARTSFEAVSIDGINEQSFPPDESLLR